VNVTRVPLVVLLGSAIAAILAPAAMADKPANKEQARAMGDPAATAPVYEHSGVYIYKGKQISADTVVKKSLHCLDDIAQSTCFDGEMEANDKVKARQAKRGKAKASAECAGGYSLLFQYFYANYGGFTAQLERRGAWYNNGSPLDNETSSYRMGEHSGHMAEGYGGAGWWLPYDTSVCAHYANLNGTGWSDRVSSRYRN
jgi:hypothetical protein